MKSSQPRTHEPIDQRVAGQTLWNHSNYRRLALVLMFSMLLAGVNVAREAEKSFEQMPIDSILISSLVSTVDIESSQASYKGSRLAIRTFFSEVFRQYRVAQQQLKKPKGNLRKM